MRMSDAFPSNYLKCADLKGKPVRFTIDSVIMEKLGEDQKPVLRFVGQDRGLALNKTNALRLVEATGSDDSDDWAGWSVVLYPTKVDYQGQRVDAIRIDDRPGATKRPVNGKQSQPRRNEREPGDEGPQDDGPPPLDDDDIGI